MTDTSLAEPDQAAVETPESSPTAADLSADDQADLGLEKLTETAEQSTDEQAQPQTYTVKINGEESEVALDDLREGYMRHSDYTQKTQELSEKEKQYAPLEQLREALSTDPKGTLEYLDSALGTNLLSQDSPSLEDTDPTERKLQELSAAQDKINQQLGLEQAKKELANEFGALHEEFGEFDDEQIAAFAVEHKILDTRDAYAAWLGNETLTERSKAAKDKILEEKDRASVVDVTPSVATGTTSPNTNRKMTIREALNLATS